MAGDHIPMMQRVAAGESLDEILESLPVAPLFQKVQERFERALQLYEKVGDRRGAMSSIIAMAYSNWAPDIHLGVGAGRHIEELRRLASRMDSFTKESERFAAEAQMLYGAHVFAQAKVVPDLALSRGEETYRQARVLGDRALEFMAAGGTALAHLDLGEVEEAKAWLDRAAAAAAESPTPFRARQLETWRGVWSGAAGDEAAMLTHLDRAVKLATEQGRPAARCEVLARLALEAARMGAASQDERLLEAAERAAGEAKELNGLLPGHPPWGAQADAALARVALARGARDEAAAAARSAMSAFESALTEDAHLEILLPAAEALQGTDDAGKLRAFLHVTLAMTAQRTLDEDVRVRWLRGPTGRKLVELSGPLEGLAMRPPEDGHPPVGESDAELMRLLLEGLSNREIGQRLGIEEPEVRRRLGAMFSRVGVRVPGAGGLGAPGQGRSASVHRSGELHHDRSDRVRLARGRFHEGRGHRHGKRGGGSTAGSGRGLSHPGHRDRGGRRAPPLAVAGQGGAPASPEDVHVHGHRAIHESGGSAR
jgi:tetratricopeptide (TPR) repeat protein